MMAISGQDHKATKFVLKASSHLVTRSTRKSPSCHMVKSTMSLHIIITAGCLAAECLVALVLCINYYYYYFVICPSAAATNELRT